MIEPAAPSKTHCGLFCCSNRLYSRRWSQKRVGPQAPAGLVAGRWSLKRVGREVALKRWDLSQKRWLRQARFSVQYIHQDPQITSPRLYVEITNPNTIKNRFFTLRTQALYGGIFMRIGYRIVSGGFGFKAMPFQMSSHCYNGCKI